MIRQVEKTLKKLLAHGLAASAGDVALYGRDGGIFSNRETVDPGTREILDRLNVCSLLLLRPASPYREILLELVAGGTDLIEPRDGETVLFLHDIPVAPPGDPDAVVRALSRRKGCLLGDGRIAAHGTVSMEQAFVTASSVCFSTFVKYFLDFLPGPARNGRLAPPSPGQARRFREILSFLPPPPAGRDLPRMPTATDGEIARAMDAAGRKTVEERLVDSFFGNISWCDGEVLHISQTGASLDELPGQIDRIPLDGSSTAGLTASAETGTHLAIYRETGAKAVLHGHPRFSVVLSMHCTEADCPHGDGCATTCPLPRRVGDVPVVPGEVGAGRYGLSRTVPPAIRGNRGVIVYGHGVFCAGESFPEVVENLASIERDCFALYRKTAGV